MRHRGASLRRAIDADKRYCRLCTRGTLTRSSIALTSTRTPCTMDRVMIQSFADETTADLFRERSTKAARRIPKELWPIVQRKLKMLDVAQRLGDLASPPGNRLESLRGNQKGGHSIRVNGQYRLTFVWEGNHAYEVCCEDYHS
jgi:toxin HigB-1